MRHSFANTEPITESVTHRSGQFNSAQLLSQDEIEDALLHDT